MKWDEVCDPTCGADDDGGHELDLGALEEIARTHGESVRHLFVRVSGGGVRFRSLLTFFINIF